MGLNVLGGGKVTDPVLPAQLDFDDFDRLVAGVVSKVLEEYSPGQERDVKRVCTRHLGREERPYSYALI